MWLDQFEFAGFYVAKEKGFYKKANLDVTFNKFTNDTNVLNEVLEGRSNFGTSSSSLIVDKSSNKDIVLLGSIFQSSPLILLALKNSNIKDIKDIKNKKIMLTQEQKSFATLKAMLFSKGILFDDIEIMKHSFDTEDLINKKADLMLAYTTNEPFILKEKGYESQIFYPKDYGFDFYEELIFTTKEFANSNPKLVKDFYNATIKGWEYAFNHIDEVARLIYNKYNPQNKSLSSLIYEANEMKKLVYDENGKIGTLKPEKIELIINTYRVMGFIKNDFKPKDLIYKIDSSKEELLNENEKKYLDSKKHISMCVDPNWLPFEKIDNGKHIGIVADYMKLLEKNINKEIKLIPSKTWTESLELAKRRECDILSLLTVSEKREKFLKFTNSYIESKLVVATKTNTPFLDNFNQMKNKKFAVIKNYSSVNLLKEKYPNIKFIVVDTMDEGLKMVVENKVFGFIDSLPSLAYKLQRDFIGELKISAKFDIPINRAIGVRKDEPILVDILNKGLLKITEDEKQNILNNWISINYQKSIDYEYFIKYIFIFIIFIVVLFLIYRQLLLNKLNKNLNERIKDEIIKNEKKNQLLIQQSRLASMGEMLENIAHQWRQPLSNISVATTGVQIKKELNCLSDKELDNALAHILNATNYLSNTIDDFRGFFKKDKIKKSINSICLINKVLDLIGYEYIKNDIIIIEEIDDFDFLSFENELIQVLINIIVNAKDAIKLNSKAKNYIFLKAYLNKDNVVFEIKDNAGGIQEEILKNVFEPYFTTKEQFNGTGIGLYMSKMLIEMHFDGQIYLENNEYKYDAKKYRGALFKIELPN